MVGKHLSTSEPYEGDDITETNKIAEQLAEKVKHIPGATNGGPQPR
ncbi:MAG: hypothetical protein MZU84_01175 [Sphingobacterium sp.]|nr:hypothetical protein [Sphingobacterium sp.]